MTIENSNENLTADNKDETTTAATVGEKKQPGKI